MGGDGSAYVGGAGEDDIDLWGGKRLEVDLAARTWTKPRRGSDLGGRFAGWEQSRIGADRLALRGTSRNYHLQYYACTATVSGRAGNDTHQRHPRQGPAHRRCSGEKLTSCEVRLR